MYGVIFYKRLEEKFGGKKSWVSHVAHNLDELQHTDLLLKCCFEEDYMLLEERIL